MAVLPLSDVMRPRYTNAKSSAANADAPKARAAITDDAKFLFMIAPFVLLSRSKINKLYLRLSNDVAIIKSNLKL